MLTMLKKLIAGARPVVLPPSNADERAAYWEGYLAQQAGHSMRSCPFPRSDEMRGYWRQGYGAADLRARKKPGPSPDTTMTAFEI